MRRTLHPHMVISLKVDGVPVDMKIISRVLSYFFLFMATFFVSMLIISLSGVTPMQAMGMAVGCLCRFDDGPLWRSRCLCLAGMD